MANLLPEIPVIEIGPGLGTLTKQLLDKNHSVYAIEIDERLYKNLNQSLDSFIKTKQLILSYGDAVKNSVGSPVFRN